MGLSTKDKVKWLLPAGLRNGIKEMLFSFEAIKTKGRVKDILRTGNPVWLEIGSGAKKGVNGWITMDMQAACDLRWDLRKGIPFPDKTLNKIYSSHLFEHLSFNEIESLLKECRRALVP